MQIEEFVPKLENGTYTRTPQDHSTANVWRKRSKNDGKIDFRMSSQAIYYLIRALAKPYVGAHVQYKGEEYKVWQGRENECEASYLEPGKVLAVNNSVITVKSGDAAIDLTKHDFTVMPRVGEYLL